ncbi:MAG TPA: hypothetical protein VII38_01390 [Polyangia bacterium]|jgi:hypothetical protein
MKVIFNFTRSPPAPRRRCFPSLLGVGALLAALLASGLASAEPQIVLPPAPDQPLPGIPRPSLLKLPRENQVEVSLDQPAMADSALGGYGEITFNAPSNGPNVVDLRRLVLYVGHNFDSHFRFYGELEFEHAVSSANDKGEAEIEQAFLDWVKWRPFNLRAGVIIIPVGIINVYHEPPTFNGVDRPLTDQLIIPSTWREPGAGFFGEWRGFRYQAYAVNGFDASGFTASAGLRHGHQEASLALGKDWGIVMRADYTLPFLLGHGVSADLGGSFYFADADQGQPQFGGAVPVTLCDADARVRTHGVELRAEIASVWIGGIHRLNRALAAAAAAMPGDPLGAFDGPVAHQLLGGYVELGYDVLHPLKLRAGRQLVPFLRYEHVDTQFDVPADLGRAPGHRQDLIVAGLTFRPIEEIALKFDYQHFWTDAASAADASYDSYNAGVAFMF